MTDPVSWDAPMVGSARKWLAEALDGWAEVDYAKVITLAPIAVEHLGKAALWHRNPVLLAPLDKSQSRSFLTLATDPDLNDPALRTIGLAEVLDRVSTVYEAALPIDGKRKKRLLDCRGGAVHVGQFTTSNAQHVLTDTLTLARWLAGLMSLEEVVVFGTNKVLVTRLLDERRSEKQRSADQRVAAARSRFQQLAQSVGPDLLHETIAQKEAATRDQLARLINRVSVGDEWTCPACRQQGILLGELETDAQVEQEWTPDGVEFYSGYDYYLIPDSFYCHVCLLTLHDPEELGFCDLPNAKYQLTGDSITDELVEFAEDQESWRRETEEGAD